MNKQEKSNAVENRIMLEKIKNDLKTGNISYEQAKVLSRPVIDGINKDIAIIAKKNNRKPYKLNFTGLMR